MMMSSGDADSVLPNEQPENTISPVSGGDMNKTLDLISSAEGCGFDKAHDNSELRNISDCHIKVGEVPKGIGDSGKAVKDTVRVTPVGQCRCDQRLPIAFICQEHGDAFCSNCKSGSHKNCKTSIISKNGRKNSKDTVKSTYKQMEAISTQVEHFLNIQQENVRKFSNMTEDCKERIRIMREKLHKFIDKIADASLLELRSCALTHTNDMGSVLDRIANIKEQAANEKNILESAISSEDAHQMSTADMIGAHKCKFFQRMISDIENDTKLPEISFEEDKTISNIVDKIGKIGIVSIRQGKCAPDVISMDLIAACPIEHKAARLCPKDAERMTGSTFMPNGDLLICDRNATLVRLFDTSFTEVSKVRLPGNPWDVTSVKSTTALVSMPYLMKLQFIETKPSMKAKTKKCITLDRKCFGVSVVDDRIFVSCSDAPGNGEIRILDMAGNLKKRLGICEDGTSELINPLYMVFIRGSKTYIASEYGKREIVNMTKTGQIQFRYSVTGASLRGMIVDKDENIFVCDESKNCVYAITDNGTNHRTFLEIPASDGDRPTSVCYRVSDGTLVVTCWKTILVYKLK